MQMNGRHINTRARRCDTPTHGPRCSHTRTHTHTPTPGHASLTTDHCSLTTGIEAAKTDCEAVPTHLKHTDSIASGYSPALGTAAVPLYPAPIQQKLNHL